jgi:murein DD-endopeptidase MepM/ murein hydrolase activator NlpD
MPSDVRLNPLPGRGGILAPYLKVSIGKDDVFVTGDGRLKSAEVTLAEGQNSSSCRFEIYDPGRIYTDKYFAHIESIGGLEGLEKPKDGSGGGRSGGTFAGRFAGDVSGDYNGADPDRIKQAIAYYQSQGLSPLGTAYLVGNMIQESTLQTDVESFDGLGSRGLIQWTDERLVGMPSDYQGQLEFALTEMERDYGGAGLRQLLSDPNATEAQVKDGLQDWIRWGDLGNRWGYAEQLYETISQQPAPNVPADRAAESVQAAADAPKAEPPKTTTNAGSQITIEMGFDGRAIAAYSFLHTSLEYSLFAPNTLTFGGQAAAWVLTQRTRNTAYTNLTFRDVAQKICESYGLALDCPESGPTYEYFPQRGTTDYETLLIEARRIGWRVKCHGGTLTLAPRNAEDSGFVLRYGDNLGLTFNVKHQAQTDSSGGARSSTPGESSATGTRKTELDPDTGETVTTAPDTPVGAGTGATAAASTTGADVAALKPKTKGTTDAADATARSNEQRVKGIVADWDAPTTPELLLLDPDTPFRTEGLGEVLDRYWVIDTISHKYSVSSGFQTSGSCYSPMKSKFPPKSSTTATGDVPPLNPGGFIKPTSGVLTSPFGPRGSGYHKGVDIAAGEGDPVWASADGVVIEVRDGCVIGDTNCGDGFGNFVFLQHADGYQTWYCHLANGSVKVAIGTQVKQGQVMAGQSDTGHSFGVHLHFQIMQGGSPIDPESVCNCR